MVKLLVTLGKGEGGLQKVPFLMFLNKNVSYTPNVKTKKQTNKKLTDFCITISCLISKPKCHAYEQMPSCWACARTQTYTHINQTPNKTSLKDHTHTHGYIKTIEKCRQFGLVSGGAVLLHKAAWWQLWGNHESSWPADHRPSVCT